MRKTVLHFTDSTGFGGAEQVLLTLIAGLDSQNWRSVLVYHPSPGLAPLIEKASRLEVELVPVPPMPDGWEGARRLPHFVRLLRAHSPEVFHAHRVWPLAGKFGLAGALAARSPAVVATVHLFLDPNLDTHTYWQHRLMAARMGRYLAVSQAVARQLVQSLPWPPQKVEVIHNGIDLLPFAALSREKISGRGAIDPRPTVFTVARLDKQKGHPYLLRAAAQVPEARFVFAGDGPERSSLEAQARALGLQDRVFFLGYCDDIPGLLANSDLFVLPSLNEGLPLVVLEAMAAGKPVIATDVGGTGEAVIPGETGLLVPPADPESLARAIRSLLTDPSLADRLARCGRARVRQAFSQERMVREVTRVYAKLLTRAAGGAHA